MQQEKLIASLKKQPLIGLLRLEKDFFHNYERHKILFSKLETLSKQRIKHIEIAWHPDPKWIELLKKINHSFPDINLGAASITTRKALNAVININLPYAMSPIWNQKISMDSKNNNQLLIPGVNSCSQFKQAKLMGYKIIKVFPASTLGIKFLEELNPINESKILIIAAGGLRGKDIEKWLKAGSGAIVLGKGLFKSAELDPSLNNWIRSQKD